MKIISVTFIPVEKYMSLITVNSREQTFKVARNTFSSYYGNRVQRFCIKIKYPVPNSYNHNNMIVYIISIFKLSQ